MAQKLILGSSKIPALCAQENVKDPIVYTKLYTMASSWTWLLTEYDPEQNLAFGFCYNSQDPDGAELGYVSLDELSALKFRGILPMVERDIHFAPCKLSEAKKKECRNLREFLGSAA